MLVIKIGGAAGVDYAALCDDLAVLWQRGERVVLVHGGSHGANTLADQLGHPAQFITSPSGHTSRLTDRRTLEIFMMATALLNRQLVEQLRARGVNALGLSGIDGGILRGTRKANIRAVENGKVRVIRDDWTGTIEHINAPLLTTLLETGYLPVIAPLAVSDQGEPLNIDGDRGAAMIAAGLQADDLLLLTNVAGVLRDFPDEASLLHQIAAADLGQAMELVQGRMKKKILGAQTALAGGVQRVIIADGRRATPIQDALAGSGTHIL